ncbi:MAG: response regulator [Bacteroidales bacterium]
MKKVNISAANKSDNIIPILTGKNILIAEDDFYSLEMLTYLLNKTNANLFSAIDGEETIKTFFNNKIDLVLLDIRLPVLNGFGVIERLRAENKETVVIAQTGFLDSSDLTKIQEAGFTDYIEKPVKEKILYNILSEYLG